MELHKADIEDKKALLEMLNRKWGGYEVIDLLPEGFTFGAFNSWTCRIGLHKEILVDGEKHLLTIAVDQRRRGARVGTSVEQIVDCWVRKLESPA